MPGKAQDIRVRRSVLYVPALNARALEKARSLDADALIIDLEDSISPARKKEAREQAVAEIGKGFGRAEIAIRINGLGTPWGAADLEAVTRLAPDAVLVPKVSTASDLVPVQSAIASRKDIGIWAMLETPLAMLNVGSIAQAREQLAPSLSPFVIGTNDLAKESRVALKPGRAAYLPWLMQCVAAARAYDIAIVDGVYNDTADRDGFECECIQGRDCGMDGKTLIHPGQIEAANRVFSPTRDDIEWALKVRRAFEQPENANAGVLAIDGRMIEQLHAEDARRVLAMARATGAIC